MKLKFRSFSHIPLSTPPHVAGWLTGNTWHDVARSRNSILNFIRPRKRFGDKKDMGKKYKEMAKSAKERMENSSPRGRPTDRPTDRLGRRQMACPKYSQWLQWHVCMVVLLCTQYEPIWNCQWTGNYWIHPPPIASSCSDCEENREKERDKHHVLFSFLQVTYQGIVRRALGHCWQIFKDSLV